MDDRHPFVQRVARADPSRMVCPPPIDGLKARIDAIPDGPDGAPACGGRSWRPRLAGVAMAGVGAAAVLALALVALSGRDGLPPMGGPQPPIADGGGSGYAALDRAAAAPGLASHPETADATLVDGLIDPSTLRLLDTIGAVRIHFGTDNRPARANDRPRLPLPRVCLVLTRAASGTAATACAPAVVDGGISFRGGLSTAVAIGAADGRPDRPVLHVGLAPDGVAAAELADRQGVTRTVAVRSNLYSATLPRDSGTPTVTFLRADGTRVAVDTESMVAAHPPGAVTVGP